MATLNNMMVVKCALCALEFSARVDDDEMHAIPGNPPNLLNLPKGCGFRSRCTHAFEQCGVKPQLTDRGDGHLSRCHLEDLE